MAKKFKDELSLQAVCDAGEPGKIYMVMILHHMPDPVADLASAVVLLNRTPGRLDWDPVVSGADLFSYPSWFYCVVRDPDGTLFLGESDGFVRHKDGVSTPISLLHELKGSLQCAYARGIDDVVFGSYAGEIVHVRGQQVTVQKIGVSRFEHVTACLNRIHGIGADFMVVVGDGGNVGRYRDGKWERIRCPSNVRLEGVWCKSEKEIYIAGSKEKAWRWDGEDRWEALEFDYVRDHIELDLTDLVGFQDQIYAAGGWHGVFRLEGNRFVALPKVKDEFVGRLAVTNIGLVGTGNVWGQESGSWFTLFDGIEWKAKQLMPTRQK
jgi:hypothetical protein